MKRKMFRIIFICLTTLLIICSVVYAANGLSEKKKDFNEETNQYELMSNYKEFIYENKSSDENKDMENIPIYAEEEIVYNNESCFLFGRDSGYYATRNIRGDFTKRILAMFPTSAIRESQDGEYVYVMYDTDTKSRIYVFFNKDNEYMTLSGFPIIATKCLSYSDFSDIKIGDNISKILKIDTVVEYYINIFDLGTDTALENYTKQGVGPTSIHLLSDGILKIEYERTSLGSYAITSIEYNEEFILDGLNGETCYKIYKKDYIQ